MARHADAEDLDTSRLEAFSDGVIAIIVTIMVLELHPPHEPDLPALVRLWPTFFSYAVSFLIVAIYWVNHRHVVRYAVRVTPLFLWLNLLVLFCTSLIPFGTAWMGEHLAAAAPNAVYAAVLFASGVSFLAMQEIVNRQNAHRVELVGVIRKARLLGGAALLIYAAGGALAWIVPGSGLIAGVLAAALYFTPVRTAVAPERAG